MRHVLECVEAFDILVAALLEDPWELLQRGDYPVSTPGSNEEIDSIIAVRARISPISDS